MSCVQPDIIFLSAAGAPSPAVAGATGMGPWSQRPDTCLSLINAFTTRRFCHFCKPEPGTRTPQWRRRCRQREHVTRSLIFLCPHFIIVVEADCILRLMQRSDRLTHLPDGSTRPPGRNRSAPGCAGGTPLAGEIPRDIKMAVRQ